MPDTITPSQPHPLDGVDDLGESVLLGLARPLGAKQSPKPLRSLVEAVLTLGVFPLLEWQRNLRRYAALEQQLFVHLAEWIRQSGREHQGDELRRVAERVGPAAILRWLIFGCVAAAAGVIVFLTWHVSPRAVGGAYRATYLFPLHAARYPAGVAVYLTWAGCLSAGYLLHARDVVGYAATAERFEQAFSQVVGISATLPRHVARESQTPIATTSWLPVFLLLPMGAFVVVAGLAHVRAIRVGSRLRRARLAVQLRALMEQTSPGVPMPMPLRRRCGNPLCEAMMTEGARFCPRCGQKGR